jgi:hypothetical protein
MTTCCSIFLDHIRVAVMNQLPNDSWIPDVHQGPYDQVCAFLYLMHLTRILFVHASGIFNKESPPSSPPPASRFYMSILCSLLPLYLLCAVLSIIKSHATYNHCIQLLNSNQSQLIIIVSIFWCVTCQLWSGRSTQIVHWLVIVSIVLGIP